MFQYLKKNWRIYLIESWALGTFMISAAVFVILIEHPALPVRALIDSMWIRRLWVGLAMGLTAVLLIYSPWGKRSGAHMNPAVTIAFLQIERIHPYDAGWYILAQFTGGYLGIALFQWVTPDYISDPSVNYVATLPGVYGIWIALVLEMLMSFVLFLTVLITSNAPKWARYTGIFAGIWVFVFITVEAPYSGMSINPARTVASAIPAHIWTGWWLYFVGPVAGMTLAGHLYRKRFRARHNGDCTTMKCHLSGHQHNCTTYDVYGPVELLQAVNKDLVATPNDTR